MKYYKSKRNQFFHAGYVEQTNGFKIGEPIIIRVPGGMEIGLFSEKEMPCGVYDSSIQRNYIECDKFGNTI